MWLWRMASAAFCVTRTTVCVTSSDLEHLLGDFQPYNSPFVFRLKLSSKNVEIVRLDSSEKENIIFLHSSNVRKLLAKISYKILDRKPKKLIAFT